MKKLIALFGILALAACGGGDEEAAVVEDTTVEPATEVAPVVMPPADTTMAAPGAMPMDTTAGVTTDTTPM